MARKESNKGTRKDSFTTLFAETVSEMFSPSSDKSLIDYSSLNIINWNDFAFLNKKQIRFFVEYIGAFFIAINLSVVSLLFLVDFNQLNNYQVNRSVSSEVLVENVQVNVLGASTVKTEGPISPSVDANAYDSCSFLVDDVRYSSNSVVSADEIGDLCVSFSSSSSSVMWQANMVGDESLVLRGDCIRVEDFSDIKDVYVYVLDSSSLVSGSCSLSFSQ